VSHWPFAVLLKAIMIPMHKQMTRWHMASSREQKRGLYTPAFDSPLASFIGHSIGKWDGNRRDFLKLGKKR
jgi:hypothetical protein